MSNKLYTLREIMVRFRRFRLSAAWLKAEADAGRIPCLKIGKKFVFDGDAVEEALLLRARKSNSTTQAKLR